MTQSVCIAQTVAEKKTWPLFTCYILWMEMDTEMDDSCVHIVGDYIHG